MSDFAQTSPHLALPYLQPAQAQKHVTHNEALRRLDALVQIAVVSAARTAPPSAPIAGARYLLPGDATGAWAGQAEGTLAVHEEDGWAFYPPRAGWTAWVEDTARLSVFDGTAWRDATALPELQNLPQLGVATVADETNRLAVAGDATLLTHAGGDHRVKINKAAAADTASLLFQTGWSGRAEMGTAGTDDLEIKVSADGTTFHSALVAEAATGRVRFPQGAEGIAPAAFGDGPLATTSYINSRGTDLVANGTGLLGNGYNYPADFTYDPQIAPNLPASFAFAGHYPGLRLMDERLAVDPNQVYRLSSYLRQEGLPGDWTAHPRGERHKHYMGLLCHDRDGLAIEAPHHKRYHHAGIDSRTTLAAPLAPGDTVIHLADASGWNQDTAASWARGIILFGYRNAEGFLYEDYSRLVMFDLFDLGQVDKTANTVTLNQPLPSLFHNPADPSGVWPAGTAIANSTSGSYYKYSFYASFVPSETDRWFRLTNHIGGIDRSGTDRSGNFAPGTAFASVLWLPNYTNRPGGADGHPDTGAAHKVWFAGVSVTPEPLAVMQPAASGGQEIKVPQGDFASGALTLVPAGLRTEML
ncbi:DUF2793 domain-containing protein [Roseovarius sp. SCSIO 43702]|uniref:DUF2793 domain-containing protein n=1 Tax=Roseovarius sp. SCSIO 43702 TaxID=2823043 RepID=UPI001C732F19|nr:DUF2793 domain-containing protein [Roseovarius sp. SCSIO 43702]QYX56535.1 DUF2793 domain-containing protein [Roseovarius sp. SCSIO 43702]